MPHEPLALVLATTPVAAPTAAGRAAVARGGGETNALVHVTLACLVALAVGLAVARARGDITGQRGRRSTLVALMTRRSGSGRPRWP